jgi:hypothetical protein
VDSGFWHRFVLTRHAPIAVDPAAFGVRLPPQPASTFARNDLVHDDPEGADHDRFDAVLPLALDAWLRGVELDRPVHTWFSEPVPTTTEAPDRIARALLGPDRTTGSRLVWLGGEVLHSDGAVVLHGPAGTATIAGSEDELAWISEVLELAVADDPLAVNDAIDGFPGDWEGFADRWRRLGETGLVRV